MKKDKLKIYILELLLIIILFFALFASKIITRGILAIILLIYMLIVKKIIKKKKTNSIHKKQVKMLMLIFSGVYLGIFYLLGLYFGFVKSKIIFSMWTLNRYIIPLTIIIISTEILRERFLSQNGKINFKGKTINVSLVLTYIATVLVDLLIYTGIYNLTNLEDFLTAIGFVLFASLSCNLLYNYICNRYGVKSIIIYRLITTLFIYIIPVMPDVYLFFRSFLRMLYPYIIYLLLEKFYAQNDFVIAYKDKRKEIIGNSILLVVITLIIMLISCQFTYGILVIGSKSMTGSINMGDAIIYKEYDGSEIKKGQVIVFDYNGIQTIHRVVEIKDVNGEIRYYTQGDANLKMDDGYTTKDEVSGLVKLRIKYIGYPTLWIRELF